MRTIKFRAWDKDYKVMHFKLEESHKLPLPQPLHTYLENTERFDIMQFTGLHDKNGKEIYEGDFLISPFTGEPAPVIYDQEYCQFTFGGAEFNVEVKHKKLEVIGNIYENPELLNN